MRTPFHTALTISGAALLASFLGFTVTLPACAVDGCVADPSDPRCSGVNVSDIQLLTNRLLKTGGPLKVTVKNLAEGARVVATLGPGGPSVNFIVDSNGAGHADVSQMLLANIPPGPLTVTIQAGEKSLTKVIHLYVPASFTDVANATVTIAGAQPSWVQVRQGHIFDTEDAGANRGVFEYQLNGSSLTKQASRPQHFGYISASGLLDISETQTVRLTPPQSGTSYLLEYADLASLLPSYVPLKMLNYTKVSWLAADRKGTVVAVAGEGTDGPLKAFTLPPAPMTAPTVAVTLVGVPATAKPVRLAWGFFDNDAQLDLIAIHSDNSVAIYLQKGVQGLTYEPTISNAVQTGAGLQGVNAQGFAAGDVDRDGLDDIIIAQSTQIVLLANEGDGTFSKTTLLNNVAVDAIAVGDVNGDGKVDLALAQKANAMLLCYTNQSP